MKSLDEESLKMYFGMATSKDYIDSLMSKVNSNKLMHDFIIAEDEDLNIVGVLHLATITEDKMEIAIAVSPHRRKQGIADKMMTMALTICQNKNKNGIFMHCLSWNKPIVNLVTKYGLKVERDGTDADAYVKLPPAALDSYFKEMLLYNQNLFQRNLNFGTHFLRELSSY